MEKEIMTTKIKQGKMKELNLKLAKEENNDKKIYDSLATDYWAAFFEEMGLEVKKVNKHDVDFLPDLLVNSPGKDVSKAYYVDKDKNHARALDRFLSQVDRIFEPEGSRYFSILNLKTTPTVYFSKGEFPICPRCGQFEYHNLEEGRGDGLTYFICYSCDMVTPCGRDNPLEEGILKMVEPYKGQIGIDYTQQWKNYLIDTANKALKNMIRR